MPIGNDAPAGAEDDLSDHEIALLCDIGDSFPSQAAKSSSAWKG